MASTEICTTQVTVTDTNGECPAAVCIADEDAIFALDESVGSNQDVQVTIEPEDLNFDNLSNGDLSLSTDGSTTNTQNEISFFITGFLHQITHRRWHSTLVATKNNNTATCTVNVKL